MGSSSVKSIVMMLLLVVMSFIIGVQAADNILNALGIIVVFMLLFAALYLGKRSWWFIFLIPPVLSIPHPAFERWPIAYIVATGVLIYWIIMWGMGYVRFRWRSLWLLDLIVLLLFICMVASYIRFPVGVEFLSVVGVELERVGGKDHTWCLFAMFYYLVISSIPFDTKQLGQILNWGMYIKLVALLIFSFLVAAGVMNLADEAASGDDVMGARFMSFLYFGIALILFLVAKYSLSQILLSPRLWFIGFAGVLSIALSGFRTFLFYACMIVAIAACLRREILLLIISVVGSYGVLIYCGEIGVLEKLPFGVQRALSAAPGVKVSTEAQRDASNTEDWRYQMWEWALNPRTGYIRDYVWGDGFGMSQSYLKRRSRALMRNEEDVGNQDYFATTGQWHNGFITCVHRLGYVGAGLIIVYFLTGVVLVLRVCRAMVGTKLETQAFFFLLPFVYWAVAFYIGAGVVARVFQLFFEFGLLKVFYLIARDNGLLMPLFSRHRYLPMMIEEQEKKLHPELS